VALALSIIALLATLYQLYLQRLHNEKSLKPLLQIDVKDHNELIYVRVQNNGLGPYIIEKLSFTKDEQLYTSIGSCISLNPKSYHNVSVSETATKVILPNNYLDVFSVRLKPEDTDKYIEQIKTELSLIRLKVHGRDIYDNQINIERDLNWFVKYSDL